MNEQNNNANGPYQYESSTERVTDPTRITGLLKSLVESRSLLTVTIPDVAEPYISALLKVEPDTQSIILDELSPASGHAHLLKARMLNVYAMLNGVDLHFKTSLQQTGEKDGIAYYRAAFPTFMHYMQRRANYRVYVGLGRAAPVELGLSDETGETIVQGRLHDLSVGGIGAMFPLYTPLQEGQTINHCVLALPGGDHLTCALEVRFLRFEESRGQLRVGAQFAGLGPREERLIQRYVLALEREAMKKQTR
jgi:c-di-GMP-binding flagellar brake protein YcgR